ncbi:hypothetical protein FGO68_gene1162 [Halteria grandinella]|uniref:Uncharacterized protein n=1 Tax=Halteria grandinella TaxID=5974 RepID=A0A8J8P713_HALGN|nr:hypothetical protein FGO68_gene1162 [Halteria grandinella]
MQIRPFVGLVPPNVQDAQEPIISLNAQSVPAPSTFQQQIQQDKQASAFLNWLIQAPIPLRFMLPIPLALQSPANYRQGLEHMILRLQTQGMPWQEPRRLQHSILIQQRLIQTFSQGPTMLLNRGVTLKKYTPRPSISTPVTSTMSSLQDPCPVQQPFSYIVGQINK